MSSNIKIKLLFIILLILAVGVNTRADNMIMNSFEKICENDFLILYFKEATTGIAIQDKSTGQIWYSNPQDLDEMEKKASGRTKEALKAQLAIKYYNDSDRLFDMDTYNDSVLHDQYKVTFLPNGLRVDYEIGKRWKDDDYIPGIISKEKMEKEVLSKLSEKEQKFLLDQYHLITLTRKEENEAHVDIFGVDMVKLMGENDIKVLSENMSERNRRRLIQEYLKKITEGQKYTTLGNVKWEDIEPLYNNPTYILSNDIIPWDKGDIIDTFKKAGYTPVNIQEDHSYYNYSPPWPNIGVFSLSVEYILEEEDLVVRIPGDSIKYPKNVINHATGNRVTYPLCNISVLPNFEAGNQEENGFMLVPDGSGAIIELNNQKTNIPPYEKPVYGKDYSVEPISEYGPYLESGIYMPVYALSKGEKGFLAIIEKGDSIANIHAQVAGMRDSYNKIYSSFQVIPRTRVSLGGDLKTLFINMYQSRNYNRDIIIRYKLLAGNDIDYSLLASVYQDYLVGKYNLARLDADENIPFIMEVMGGINKTVPVMGIPRRVVIPLSGYRETAYMIEELQNKGIDKLTVLYNGWSAGGIKHRLPNKVRLEKKLGSEKEFLELIDLMKKDDIDFYPEISFLNLYQNKPFDGFVTIRNNARFLNRKYAFIYDFFWIDTYQANDDYTKQIISPSFLGSLVDGFMKDYRKYDINGLALRYIGTQINSDFRVNVDKLIDREQAKDIIIEQLEKINKKDNIDLVFREGNFYTIPYSKYIVDVPIYSGSNSLFDQGIPFYQMVLHGYKNYTGEPINLASKPRVQFLKLLEVGGVPYYRWSYNQASLVKKSVFDDQYSIYFYDYLDEAVDYYHELNSILGKLQEKRIIRHERLANDVYQVTYEGDNIIIVNYNQEAVEVAGLKIDSLDYKFIKGED